MISVDDAFKKFLSRLELSDAEDKDASRRQKEIRAYMDESFDIEDDFLTGSYRRWTKTKPLKDVDIFCVMGKEERHYRDEHPSNLLNAVEKKLAEKYGKENVDKQRRSVSVRFGVTADADEDTGGKVMSFDVVPAFTKSGHYEIPDAESKAQWTQTDPQVHYDLAVKAQEAYKNAWKAIVRMVKKWNAHAGKPVRPSFLIEVMALELLYPPFGGDYRYEVKSLFASMADRIEREWPDPAGLGPPVSDSMNAAARQRAKASLLKASDAAAAAIRHEKQGRAGEALRTWREQVFGPLFPLS